MGDLERRMYQEIIEFQDIAIQSCHSSKAWSWSLVGLLILLNIICIFIIMYLVNKDYIHALFDKTIKTIKRIFLKIKSEIQSWGKVK